MQKPKPLPTCSSALPGGVGRLSLPDPAPQDREKKKMLQVHEKMTSSSKVSAKHASLRRELQLEDEMEDLEVQAHAEQLRTFHDQMAWKLSKTRGAVPDP